MYLSFVDVWLTFIPNIMLIGHPILTFYFFRHEKSAAIY